jgi:hypothetical protein
MKNLVLLKLTLNLNPASVTNVIFNQEPVLNPRVSLKLKHFITQ